MVRVWLNLFFWECRWMEFMSKFVKNNVWIVIKCLFVSLGQRGHWCHHWWQPSTQSAFCVLTGGQNGPFWRYIIYGKPLQGLKWTFDQFTWNFPPKRLLIVWRRFCELCLTSVLVLIATSYTLIKLFHRHFCQIITYWCDLLYCRPKQIARPTSGTNGMLNNLHRPDYSLC